MTPVGSLYYVGVIAGRLQTNQMCSHFTNNGDFQTTFAGGLVVDLIKDSAPTLDNLRNFVFDHDHRSAQFFQQLREAP